MTIAAKVHSDTHNLNRMRLDKMLLNRIIFLQLR